MTNSEIPQFDVQLGDVIIMNGSETRRHCALVNSASWSGLNLRPAAPLMPKNCLQIGVRFGTQTEIVASLNGQWFRLSGTIPPNTPGSPNEDRPARWHDVGGGCVGSSQWFPVEKMIDAERVTCRKEVVGRFMSQTETKMEVDLLSRSNAPGSADVKYLT